MNSRLVLWSAVSALAGFLFFCGMMVLQLVWFHLMVPETKGISFDERQRKLGIEPAPAWAKRSGIYCRAIRLDVKGRF